ncbi:hypothetical protein ND860_17750 [Leptospira levettii]|uniref:hypothetical protein n=1 Tax=Leptospira levettii TaxID=2023178 RepID=UPI00223D259D|nr:hypothetical protein [Leptospira levettii]MCW7498386.1 hypothetical protein [Leptospira levettii]
MAVLGLSAFMGTGAGGDVAIGATYVAWGTTSCATGWNIAYTGYMQLPYIRSATSPTAPSSSGSNYGPQEEMYMTQFADNVQNCVVCVK